MKNILTTTASFFVNATLLFYFVFIRPFFLIVFICIGLLFFPITIPLSFYIRHKQKKLNDDLWFFREFFNLTSRDDL